MFTEKEVNQLLTEFSHDHKFRIEQGLYIMQVIAALRDERLKYLKMAIRAAVINAKPVQKVIEDSKKVAVQVDRGRYWVLTESDIMFPEIIDSLARLLMEKRIPANRFLAYYYPSVKVQVSECGPVCSDDLPDSILEIVAEIALEIQ